MSTVKTKPVTTYKPKRRMGGRVKADLEWRSSVIHLSPDPPTMILSLFHVSSLRYFYYPLLAQYVLIVGYMFMT